MMTAENIQRLTIATASGAGISGGVFFAFSTFVMPALKRLPHDQGIAAMQSINLKAVNPLFMVSLFGPAIGSFMLIASARSQRQEPASNYLLIGGATYLFATAVTLAVNVPKNNALAKLDPASPSAAQAWATYATIWTTANHVRAIASIASAVLLTLASRRLP